MRAQPFPSCLLALIVALAGCDKKKDKPTTQESPAAAARTAEVPEAKTARSILEAAIAARGGADKIKAASSWKATWKGTSKGTAHTGTMIFREGEVRRDFSTPDGKAVITVRADGICWNRIGENAGRCSQAEEKLCKQGIALNRAAMLWPLTQEDWKLEAGTREAGGKVYDTLEAASATLGAKAILVIDPDTHLVHQTILPDATVGGQTGDIVADILETKQLCGTVMTVKNRVSFMGTEIQTNETTGFQCGPIDPKIFAYKE